MEISKITKETASIASHIYAKSWKTAYRKIVPDSYLDTLSLERWTPLLSNSPFSGYLLSDNGKYIATTSISKARDDKMEGFGEIISIYLLPEYFNQGYGSILIKFALSELFKEGFSKIYLWVLEDNLSARKFYEKHGFKPNGDKEELIIAEKKLIELRYTLE